MPWLLVLIFGGIIAAVAVSAKSKSPEGLLGKVVRFSDLTGKFLVTGIKPDGRLLVMPIGQPTKKGFSIDPGRVVEILPEAGPPMLRMLPRRVRLLKPVTRPMPDAQWYRHQ